MSGDLSKTHDNETIQIRFDRMVWLLQARRFLPKAAQLFSSLGDEEMAAIAEQSFASHDQLDSFAVVPFDLDSLCSVFFENRHSSVSAGGRGLDLAFFPLQKFVSSLSLCHSRV